MIVKPATAGSQSAARRCASALHPEHVDDHLHHGEHARLDHRHRVQQRDTGVGATMAAGSQR